MKTRLLWWLVPLALVLVRLHNVATVPFHHGYDNYGHVLNLKKIAFNEVVPLANEGFSAYHPPLYYQVSAFAWRLIRSKHEEPWKAAQVVSALSSIGLLICTWACARMLIPGYEWFAVTALAALPMELIMAAMIYNVPLASLFAGMFLVVLLRAWPRERPVLWEEAALGLLAGAACLTRLDGFILLAGIAALFAHRAWRGPARGDALLAAVLALMIAAGVAGWFYLRNLAEFGRLFVTNAQIECYPFWGITETLPGFRSLTFYLGGDLALLTNPDFPSQTPYFWGMEYASIWWDHLRFFSPRQSPVMGRVLVVLGLAPTLLSLLGLLTVAADPNRRARWAPVLVMGGAASAFHLLFTLTAPLYSAVKPMYLFSALAPWALVTAAGAARIVEGHPARAPWVRTALTALAACVAVAFWYR